MKAREKRIEYSRRFQKNLRKASPKIQQAFLRRRRIFREHPNHPLLNNHRLTGQYKGCRSINVTGDWRAIYQETKKEIIFIDLGTHSQLYR